MTPHERALELVRLSLRDERAAAVLQDDASIDAATIAFHYQQAVEKLLKALLAERNVDYPRTHDLGELAALSREAGFEVPVPEDELLMLTPFAVTFRYEDDELAEQIDLSAVATRIDRLREWVERQLE